MTKIFKYKCPKCKMISVWGYKKEFIKCKFCNKANAKPIGEFKAI